MTKEIVHRLQHLCNTVPALMLAIPEDEFSRKDSPQQWSRKQVLGHLIDSATNNHHRLVRAQFENSPMITYDQDLWNTAGFYQEMDRGVLITFWTAYNRQLAMLIDHITPEIMERTVSTGPGSLCTLRQVAADYIVHLEHHLRQILPDKNNDLNL